MTPRPRWLWLVYAFHFGWCMGALMTGCTPVTEMQVSGSGSGPLQPSLVIANTASSDYGRSNVVLIALNTPTPTPGIAPTR